MASNRGNESLESVPPVLWEMLTSDEQMLFLLADDVHNGRITADELPDRLRLMRRSREAKESTLWFRDTFGYDWERV